MEPRNARWAGPLLVLLVAAGLDLLSCHSHPPLVLEPVDPGAGALMEEARARLALDSLDLDGAGRSAARAAAAAAPDWVAPRRLVDDVERTALRGPEALARRLDELEQDPADAGAWYLAGRLEGVSGSARFDHAAGLDRNLAWPLHGQAWAEFRFGRSADAARYGQRALERARDATELAFFAGVQARYLLAVEREEQARSVLLRALADERLTPRPRRALELRLAIIELASLEPGPLATGLRRGLALLRADEPDPAELRELVLTLGAAVASGALTDVELAAALTARPSALRDALRAELDLARGSGARALGLWRRGAVTPLTGRSLRAERFAAGEARAALADWQASLPRFLLGAEGRPRDPRLAAIVDAAAGDDPRALGEALLVAGWFAEARGLAETVASERPELAREFEARALAGLALVAGIERVLSAADGEDPLAAAHARGADADGDMDLDELLAALGPLFDQAGGDGADLAASPRLDFGPLASVAHPGPRFSRLDGELGRGTPGVAVPGLARELDRIGRFGVFGEAVGTPGPDGVLLPVLLVEQRSGTHLGVRWSGTVAWCESPDVRSRPGRLGARISGAAVHEGYWVDVDAVRVEESRWRGLEARFLAPGREELVAAALATVGPRVGVAPGTPAERDAPYALLGAGDRIRLAVLVERRANGGEPPLVALDELLAITAVHEEGHLCDRARFLPLSRHKFAALRFAWEHGFSPDSIARALEKRAQLVALCAAPDPRLALAECFDSAEDGGLVTPHPAAYLELAGEWLRVLEELRVAGEVGARLDPERYLVHQLHALSAAEVRRVSLALAERRGLSGD